MRRGWGRRSISLVESILSNYGVVYTFLILYAVVNMLLFASAAVSESKLHDDVERYTTTIARGAGAMINFNAAFVILLASRLVIGFLRNTPLTYVLPLDRAMPDLHKVVGIILLAASMVHSIAHIVTYSTKFVWAGGFSGRTSLFVSGIILLLLMITIRMSARSAVYHASYETFIRLHVCGSILMYIALMIHGLNRGTPSSWKWTVGPIVIYVFDRGVRFFREKRSYLLVTKHSAVFQGPDILKIRLPRVFHFQAGQYAEIKVPALSQFQWHPFTIASAPHEAEMVFYIKAVGNWTTALYHLFRENASSQSARDMEVHVRGPYGASSQHVGQFDRVILIGGGVGATPFCSVVKDAYNWVTNWAPQSHQMHHQRGENPTGEIYERPPKKDEHTNNNNPQPSKRANALTNDNHEGVPSQSLSFHDDGSHLFTTNILTDNFESVVVDDQSDESANDEAHRSNQQQVSAHPQSFRNNESSGYGPNGASNNSSMMMTARETISDPKGKVEFKTHTTQTTKGTENSSDSARRSSVYSTTVNVGNIQFDPVPNNGEDQSAPRKMKSNLRSKAFRSSLMNEDMRMGTFHENATGTYRRSLDYLSALHSAYAENETNEIFRKSLDLMVGMSFGSVSLVRNLQIRKAQKKMRDGPNLSAPFPTEIGDISLLQQPRIIMLLFLRSVTITMILIWILLLRFVTAITAAIFGKLTVFRAGVALYNVKWLIIVDMILVALLLILIGLPSVLEIFELGAAPVHGFDFFVLLPLVGVEFASHIVSLVGVGENINLFGIIHVFVLWPLLFIMMMIRLLRIIGERGSQNENITVTQSATKTVDFYWTAPSPEDDQWLVNELSSCIDSSAVHIHRYLTRVSEEDIDLRGTMIRKQAKNLYTNYGRPDWDMILNEFSEKSPNNSTIGVFFCGPHTMGEAVQDACFSAMRNSIIRGLQSGARVMRDLEEVFGDAVSANEFTGEFLTRREVTAQGCNVKFVFRRETFL